jgi:nucleoside-diphosphate-sugar epimerase
MEKQQHGRDAVLLTGATGALGSELLNELIARGYRVICLARDRGGTAAKDRIRPLVYHDAFVKVIRGDIHAPLCGVSREDISALRDHVGRVIHCAASIKFEDQEATEAANVNGVRNILALADAMDVQEFHHVSTAYVAGGAEISVDADPTKNCAPRNSYEKSKLAGEALVRDWSSRDSTRRCGIYRPSIFVGRRDGTTPTFDAYYGWLHPFHRIAEAIRKRDQNKSLPLEVRFDPSGGIVTLPLSVRMSRTSTLNLVPIDWVAQAIVRLVEAPWRRETFLLVQRRPPLVSRVLEFSLHCLRIGGVKIIEHHQGSTTARETQSPLLKRIQKNLNPILNQYVPYTNHEPVFIPDNAERFLPVELKFPPAIDEGFLSRLLDYAIATNFGAAVG